MAPKDDRYYAKHGDEIRKKARERARAKREGTTTSNSQAKSAGEGAESIPTSLPGSQYPRRHRAGDVDPLLELMDDFWNQPQLPSVERLLLGITHDIRELQSNGPSLSRVHYDQYISSRDDVSRWTCAFGGIMSWHDGLDLLFQAAIHKSHSLVMQLIERLWLHQTQGKVLLRKLQAVDGFLPHNPIAVAMLWSNQQGLVIEVVKGLTILDIKLPVMYRTTLSSIDASPESLSVLRAARAVFRSNGRLVVPGDYMDPLPPSDGEPEENEASG